MGGGGGDTTNVTNTGLGDDQYQALADNQVGISDQITDVDKNATKRYNQFDTRFGNLDTSISQDCPQVCWTSSRTLRIT